MALQINIVFSTGLERWLGILGFSNQPIKNIITHPSLATISLEVIDAKLCHYLSRKVILFDSESNLGQKFFFWKYVTPFIGKILSF